MDRYLFAAASCLVQPPAAAKTGSNPAPTRAPAAAAKVIEDRQILEHGAAPAAPANNEQVSVIFREIYQVLWSLVCCHEGNIERTKNKKEAALSILS